MFGIWFFLQFIINFTGKLEADDAELSLVYHYFGRLLEHYKADNVVLPKVQYRWEFIKTKIHAVSYILTPRFAAEGDYFEEKLEIMSCTKEYAETQFPGTGELVMEQLIKFIREMETLPDSQKETIDKMKAIDYWEIIGKTKYPDLYRCGKIVSSMTCSSASAERVWSIFGFVHTPLRNRLANDKVEKLVFLYVNAGLLDENDKRDYISECIAALDEDEFDE